MPVWTKSSGTTFIPFVRLPVNEAAEVKPAFLLQSSTGDLEVQAALQYSDDGQSWGSLTTFGPSATASETWQYGSAYTTLSVARRFALIGVQTSQASGSDREAGQVTLVLDVRSA